MDIFSEVNQNISIPLQNLKYLPYNRKDTIDTGNKLLYINNRLNTNYEVTKVLRKNKKDCIFVFNSHNNIIFQTFYLTKYNNKNIDIEINDATVLKGSEFLITDKDKVLFSVLMKCNPNNIYTLSDVVKLIYLNKERHSKRKDILLYFHKDIFTNTDYQKILSFCKQIIKYAMETGLNYIVTDEPFISFITNDNQFIDSDELNKILTDYNNK